MPTELETQITEELKRAAISATRLVEYVVRYAHSLHASDIHFDPQEDGVQVQLRVDGLLQDACLVPPRAHSELIARLKILASLRINEHYAPQDGRFRSSLPGTTPTAFLDIRISIAPTYYGENAVLRLLSSRAELTELEALGFSTPNQETIRENIARPHGLILITGPTGSGKTSTLYALIHALYSRAVAITTIEDPIEYSIQGINQMQANRRGALTFAEGLRSILRQDPNVIGIGEIRDAETASLAIHAALTGHLVISTLHTTNAPTALPRLMDMGIEPYLIGSTVRLIIGQRLLRKMCESCRISRTVPKHIIEQLSTTAAELIPKKHFIASGCDACFGKGFQGRIGVFEIVSIDNNIRAAIEQKRSAQELFTLACSQGMTPLFGDGLQKVSQGLVLLEDVLTLLHE